MDITKISDEELEKEIRGRCITNMAAKDLTKFIRQCVADSQLQTLNKEGIKSAIEDWLSCGESRLTPDDVDEIAETICDRLGTPANDKLEEYKCGWCGNGKIKDPECCHGLIHQQEACDTARINFYKKPLHSDDKMEGQHD